MTAPSTPAGTAETHAELLAWLDDISAGENDSYAEAAAAIRTLAAENERLTAELRKERALGTGLVAAGLKLATDNEAVKRNATAAVQASESAREQAEAALAEVLKKYVEAVQEISDWGAYADKYFQEKHGLAETVAEHRAFIAALSPAAAASPHPTAERNEGHE